MVEIDICRDDVIIGVSVDTVSGGTQLFVMMCIAHNLTLIQYLELNISNSVAPDMLENILTVVCVFHHLTNLYRLTHCITLVINRHKLVKIEF